MEEGRGIRIWRKRERDRMERMDRKRDRLIEEGETGTKDKGEDVGWGEMDSREG